MPWIVEYLPSRIFLYFGSFPYPVNDTALRNVISVNDLEVTGSLYLKFDNLIGWFKMIAADSI